MEALIEKYSNSLIHLESTSCEEYEIVKNTFAKIIKEVRREREIFQLANAMQQNEEIFIQKNSKIKSNHNNNNNSKRTKSPKNTIHETSNHLNMTSGPQINAISTSINSSVTISNSNNNSSNFNSNINKESSIAIKKNKFPFLNKILNKNSSNM